MLNLHVLLINETNCSNFCFCPSFPPMPAYKGFLILLKYTADLDTHAVFGAVALTWLFELVLANL